MAYDSGFYKAIELAVNTTGAAGVQALDANVAALKGQISAYQAQIAAGQGITAKQIDDLADLAHAHDRASAAAAAGQRVLAGLPVSMDATQKASGGAARGVLELSRAFEDFTTGGPLGALNNIPGIFQSIGQAAGLGAPQVALLTAGVSGLATAAYIAYTHWDSLVRAFQDKTAIPAAIANVESLGKVIHDADKVMDDLRKNTTLTADEMERFKRAETDKGLAQEKVAGIKAGADLFGDPPDEARARAKSATEAIGAAGGGEAFKKALTEYVEKNLSVVDRPRQVDGAGKEISPETRLYRDVGEKGPFSYRLGSAEEAVNKIAEMLKKGDVGAYGHAEALPGGFGDAFMAQSPEMQAFGESEADLHDRTVAGLKSAREKREAKARDAEKARRELEGRVRDAVTTHGPGFDDALQSRFFGVAKAGGDVEAAKREARPALVAGLRDRGVGEDAVGDAVGKLIEKAAAVALNHAQEGTLPKAETRQEREKAKAAKDREAAVEEDVKRIGPGFDQALQQAMLRRLAQGQTPGQAGDALTAQVAARLPGREVAADLVPDVARAIVRKVRQQAENSVDAERAARPGLTPPQAANNLNVERNAKLDQADDGRVKSNQTQVFGREFQQRTGANDAQAEQAGAAIAGLVAKGAPVEQAMQQTYSTMMQHAQQVQAGMLRQQAIAEQMMNVLGPATQALGQLQARQGALNANIQQARANMGRATMQSKRLNGRLL